MSTRTRNHIVIYSGGMDSFTLLHWVNRFKAHPYQTATELSEVEHRIFALSFNYGQRHIKELQCAAKVCKEANLPHRVIELGALYSIAKGSALTDPEVDVPHGHYAAESMKKTVVPGRNTVMLAMALAYAEGLDPHATAAVYYGAHAGDHAIYPDCRPPFVNAMTDTFYNASDGRVELVVPFLMISKSDILAEGLKRMGLPASAYANTWTCYEGRERPCGLCGACNERAEAFADCKAIDPLVGS